MHIRLLQPPPRVFLVGLKSWVSLSVDANSVGHRRISVGGTWLWRLAISLPLPSALPGIVLREPTES